MGNVFPVEKGFRVLPALAKLAGPQHPAVELETVRFRDGLSRALAGEADPPHLEFRTEG